MQPTSKRPLTSQHGGPRAQTSGYQLDACSMTPNFLRYITGLRNEYGRCQGSLVELLLEQGLDPSMCTGVIELEAFQGDLRGPGEKLVDVQYELIREMFDFMSEAAVLLGLPDSELVLDKARVLPLAVVFSAIVSKRTLQEYVQATVRYYLVLVDKQQETATSAALRKYVDLGRRIRHDPEAVEFIDAIWRGFKQGLSMDVFNALCVPSGTGKTQLAFSLPDECAVIYMNMTLYSGEKAVTTQAVYDSFAKFMKFLLEKLPEDFAKSRNSERNLWMYGFVKALMELLTRFHDQLDLPADLSRLQVSEFGSDDQIQACLISPAAEEVARVAIEKFVNRVGRSVLFFVDEFTAGREMDHRLLAFFRRRLMDLKCCLVVASTDSGAVNMLNADAATDHSRGENRVWVNLCTQLPRYVPEGSLRELVERYPDEKIKKLLTLCLQSRPFFAGCVEPAIREFSATAFSESGVPATADVQQFVERLRETVVEVRSQKSGCFTVEGCYGYVAAMLSAGFCYPALSEDEKKLFANLTTKNWAYLLNEGELSKVGISHEKVQVDGESDEEGWRSTSMGSSGDELLVLDPAVAESSDRQSTAVELLRKAIPRSGKRVSFVSLFRKAGNSLSSDKLFVTGDLDRSFEFLSYFPDPIDDFLFYLGLAGSAKRPGLIVQDHRRNLVRVSVAKIVRDTFPFRKRSIPSKNVKMPEWDLHEMIVCAAFMSASNSGPLGGITLEELLTQFVAELVESDKEEFVKLETVDKIEWAGSFVGQFMWPYDTDLPSDIDELLNTAQSTRPSNTLMFDAGTYRKSGHPPKYGFKALVEAKTTTNPAAVRSMTLTALRRQDSMAKVGFIVFDQTLKQLGTIDLSVLRVLDKEGCLMTNARLFQVTIDGNRKVVLQAVDGRGKSTQANRLIFLISRDDINAAINSL